MNNIEMAYSKFCEERFSLPTEKQVADLEQGLGIQLPPDYRQFLLQYNGGVFRTPSIIPPSKDCPEDGLKFLKGLAATYPCAELASEPDLTLFDDNDPPQILPIGNTLMGNLIFLITHPEDRGIIGLKKAFSDQSFFLASGIEEFFGLLREPTLE